MRTTRRLYHGGVPGLDQGDVLEGGHDRHQHDGCPICAARAAGGSPLDPASARPDHVYLTASKDYARYYASLYGHGDLYVVRPIGPMEATPEDRFPSWTCPRVRIVEVLARGVLLSWHQREELFMCWAERDGIGPEQARVEFLAMKTGTLAQIREQAR